MKVQDVMTPNPACCARDDPAQRAAGGSLRLIYFQPGTHALALGARVAQSVPGLDPRRGPHGKGLEPY